MLCECENPHPGVNRDGDFFVSLFLSQLRRRLPPLPLALITALAVFPLPEEQPVHHAPGLCPHPVPRPAVTARGQTFVAISAYDCVEKLVYSNQHVFDVLSSRNFHVFPPKMSFMQANDTLNFFAISFLVHFPRRFFICMTCSSVSFAELFFSPLFIHEYL